MQWTAGRSPDAVENPGPERKHHNAESAIERGPKIDVQQNARRRPPMSNVIGANVGGARKRRGRA